MYVQHIRTFSPAILAHPLSAQGTQLPREPSSTELVVIGGGYSVLVAAIALAAVVVRRKATYPLTRSQSHTDFAVKFRLGCYVDIMGRPFSSWYLTGTHALSPFGNTFLPAEAQLLAIKMGWSHNSTLARQPPNGQSTDCLTSDLRLDSRFFTLLPMTPASPSTRYYVDCWSNNQPVAGDAAVAGGAG